MKNSGYADFRGAKSYRDRLEVDASRFVGVQIERSDYPEREGIEYSINLVTPGLPAAKRPLLARLFRKSRQASHGDTDLRILHIPQALYDDIVEALASSQ